MYVDRMGHTDNKGLAWISVTLVWCCLICFNLVWFRLDRFGWDMAHTQTHKQTQKHDDMLSCCATKNQESPFISSDYEFQSDEMTCHLPSQSCGMEWLGARRNLYLLFSRDASRYRPLHRLLVSTQLSL